MANEIEILTINGVEYTLIDSTAVHTVDTAISSSSTNPVQNKVIKAALDKKGTLISLSTATATALLDYYSFSVSAADITAINAAHDGVIISFGSSSAFGANETFVGFLNETTLWNGISYLAYSGTISAATSLDSNLFVLLLPKTGNGGTGYIKVKNVATKGDVGDALDDAENYADTKIVAAIEALDAAVSGLGTGKTITALSETDGIISATASNIAIAGSQVTSGNIAAARMPTGYMKEAYLEWGGKNFSAGNGPLDAALINTLGADRFAFIPAACITVEYSTDAGTTWVDYGFNDSQKAMLFAPGIGANTYLGKHTSAGSGTANDQLRITVDTYYGSQRVYSTIRKFVMYGSTNGAANTTWSLQVRTTANVLNNVDAWQDVFADVAWGGWSGINIAQTNITIGSNTPTSSNTQYRQFRLIFKQGTPNASYASSQIIYIMGYGGVGWSTPSYMAKHNSLYTYDYAQNAAFPARVKATELKGLGANYYGTCTTAAGTAAKVVTCTDFVLTAGARISVRFTNGSTSTDTMQLNVNSTGAKNCGVYLYNGTWQTYANRCEKNTVLEFVYDGTYWVTITPYALRNFGTYASHLTSADVSWPDGGLQYFLATASMTTGKPPVDSRILNMNWDNGSAYGAQFAVAHGTTSMEPGRLWTRGQNGTSTWSSWREIPRLSGALTNGQIVVSDESTGNALLKGITYDYKLTLSTTFTDVDADTISFSLSNDQLTGLNDYMSGAVSGGYTGMVHVSFTAPLPNSDTHDAVYIAHSALLDEYDMKWVFSGTVYDSVDKTTYPFTFSYPIASTGPVTATVKLNRASGGRSLDPVEDSDVFLSRAVNFGENKYKFPSLVGGTVAWNQLIKNGNFVDTSNWTGQYGTISAANNKLTYTRTSVDSAARIQQSNIGFLKDHKYSIHCALTSSVATVARIAINIGSIQQIATFSLVANTKKDAFYVFTPTADASILYLYNDNNRAGSIGDTVIYENVWCVDLTLALGPTIADYIYSLEQATTGAGVNWFKQYFPKSYYPFNAGALISVNPTGAETMGVNLFDKSKIVAGYISDSNGDFVSNAAHKATDYISVIGNVDYYIKSDQTSAGWGAWYDSSKAYISGITGYISGASSSKIYSAPANAAYMRLTIASSATGDPDTFSVSVSSPLYNGTYYPYTHHSYPISPIELRGIPKLISNKLAFDGDVRASDGTVTRKYGIVDLGTLSWSYGNNGGQWPHSLFYASVSGKAAPYNRNMICSAYIVSELGVTSSDLPDKSITVSSGAYIYVYDSAYTTAAAFKTAMSGVYLVYELATPTTESSEALPVPQVVYDGGIESYIDERDVQVPVGQDATYMDAASAIGELMDSGLVPSSGGVSQTSGTFVLGGTGTTITSQWNYVKTGKEVTIYGGFANFMSSSSMTTLFGLPFTPAYSIPVHLSCYVLNVGKFDVVMRLNTDKTMTVECATLIGTNGTVTYLSVPSSTFAYYLIYLSAEIRYITNE